MSNKHLLVELEKLKKRVEELEKRPNTVTVTLPPPAPWPTVIPVLTPYTRPEPYPQTWCGDPPGLGATCLGGNPRGPWF
jgi:hypothetical protein